MMKRFCCAFFFAALSFAAPAQAVEKPGAEPLTINAAGTLEWHRDEGAYVATGNVIARQGKTQITADKLTARYRDKAAGEKTEKGAPRIDDLIAEGNVIINNGAGGTATGDHAIYTLATGEAVLTGQASATSDDNRITAQKITAFMGEDESKKRVMLRAVAEGDVVITTPTETVTGTRAEYVRATNLANLAGPVKITRGKNVLNGARAQVNLATHVSTLFGEPGAKAGRVTGVFYPNEKDKLLTPTK